MFRKIMVPVDLLHLDQLEPALREARRLAALYGAELCYVGVTAAAPGPAGHSPEAYAGRLDAFAAGQAKIAGRTASVHVIVSHDPTVDLDAELLAAIPAVGADLVVMGTHRPGWREHIFSSHAGHLASHAPVSVVVIR